MTFQSLLLSFRRWLSPEPESSLPHPAEPMADFTGRDTRVVAAATVADAPLEQRAPANGVMLRKRVYDAFNSSMPVATRHGLAGRQAELDRLCEAVLYRSSHAIIFGPRGSGKTSLARIFGDMADEMRTLVLYNLASGDVNFADLFRPYLVDLAVEIGQPALTSFADGDFDARSLASKLIESVKRPTVVVLDEFDRIVSTTTKREIAALMKLLSDMRANVRLLLVGIAGDIADLLEGHPSLRRHLVAVPIGGIDDASMHNLLQQLASRAGMTVDDEALALLTSASRGSPYHSRLFGLHAGLVALENDRTSINLRSVKAGLSDAFIGWLEVGGAMSASQMADLTGRTQIGYAMTLIASTNAMSLRFDRAKTVSDLTDLLFDGDAGKAIALTESTIARMANDLQMVGDDQYLFIDPLKPQFIIELYRGSITPPITGPGFDRSFDPALPTAASAGDAFK